MTQRNKPFGIECVSLLSITSVATIAAYILPLSLLFFDSLFTDDGFGGSRRFVSMAQYASVVTDNSYATAALATFAFAIPTVIVQLLGALLLGTMTSDDSRWSNIVRAMIFAPYLLPTVVVVLAWRFVSDPFVGILPALLRTAFGSSPHFGDPAWTIPVMICVEAYEALPFSYVVLLARLRQIPRPLYEVAEIHGSGPWASFLAVTWPHIRRTFYVLLMLRFLLTWLKFDIPWLIYASRGSFWASDTLAVGAYRSAFSDLNWGKACALSVIMLSIAGSFYTVFALFERRIASRYQKALND